MDNNQNATNLRMQGFLSKLHCPETVPIKTHPLTDEYTVESRPFARGKFATVRRCRHKDTGCDYAAKYIRKRRRAVDVRHEIMHEVSVLKLSCNCFRIVNLHEVFETSTEIILILEMAAGGELQRVLDDEEIIEEAHAVRLMYQILEGVAFLHEHNIAHMDIKPQNILLTGAFPQCDVKLCDFGISRLISNGIEIREICGTPDYVAPEILQYEPISLVTDMWSVGILAYVLLSGHTPFGGETKQETFCNITTGNLEFPDELFMNVSNAAKDFIQRLLMKDPRERISAKESLCHSWLRSQCIPVSTSLYLTMSKSADSGVSPATSPEVVEDDINTDKQCKSYSGQQHQPCNEHHQKGIMENGSTSCLILPLDQNHCLSHSSNGAQLEHVTQSKERSNVKNKGKVENMVVELEGLSLTKRIIFSTVPEDIIVEERVGIVY